MLQRVFQDMTYGRARLWLGVTSVGSVVVIASIALALQLPQRLLECKRGLDETEFLQLAAVIGLFLLWLVPMDFLGGYLLPRKFRKSGKSFSDWLGTYLKATFFQAILFVFFGSSIVLLSQAYGTSIGLISIGLFMIGCFLVRNRLMLNHQVKSASSQAKLSDAVGLIQTWQIFVPRTVVVEHTDVGFTGGVIGLGNRAIIVIPEAWLSFRTEELATAIARRALAVNTGSYTRGLVFAYVWNLAGFSLCWLLTGADLASVAGLVTAMCAFTLWSFFGLLVLPTISRNASLKIDQELAQHGLPVDLISTTASTMDYLQDDEPQRSRFIETIFHPVPSVKGRSRSEPIRGLAAWNVSRTSLFLSWACLGFLSRSVHCNVGRPELWTMMPTD